MAENIYTTTILLLNSKPEIENGKVKKWLRQSRFATREAANISQAIEMIYDFTISQSPDVILLEIESFIEDYPLIGKMLAAASADGQISVLSLSDSKPNDLNKSCFQGSFEQIKTELDKLQPKHARAAA